jgi:hypothetical protein
MLPWLTSDVGGIVLLGILPLAKETFNGLDCFVQYCHVVDLGQLSVFSLRSEVNARFIWCSNVNE